MQQYSFDCWQISQRKEKPVILNKDKTNKKVLYAFSTYEPLIDASSYIKMLEEHQGLKVCCPEEIAYKHGWINKDILLEQGHLMEKNQYGQHLLNVANGKNEY